MLIMRFCVSVESDIGAAPAIPQERLGGVASQRGVQVAGLHELDDQQRLAAN